MASRPLRHRYVFFVLGLGVAACGIEEPRERATATAASALTDGRRADLCGSARLVELSTTLAPAPHRHHHEVRHATDEHTFCEPIPIVIPATIQAIGPVKSAEVTLVLGSSAHPGGANIDLRGRETVCHYRPREKKGSLAAYTLYDCTGRLKAGATVTAERFALVLNVEKPSSQARTARVRLGDGQPARPDQVTELRGTTAALDGVVVTVPATAPAFSVGLRMGTPLTRDGFVASGPVGQYVVGPSVEVTGDGPFLNPVRVRLPYDATFIAGLPGGALESLRVMRVRSAHGPAEAIDGVEADEVTEGVSINHASGTIEVLMGAPGFLFPAVADTRPVMDYGGPVMKDGVTVYLIWVGDFASRPALDPRTHIRDFVRELGASAWYDSLRAYRIANRQLALSPREAVMPTIGTLITSPDDPDPAQYSVAVTKAITEPQGPENKPLPVDPNGIYLVVGAPNVTEGPDGGFCNRTCGWHNHTPRIPATVARGVIGELKFAFIGHPTACRELATAHTGCAGAPQPSPHGNDIDSMINTVAHEIVETVTDPEYNAWTGGAEVADKCAWRFPGTRTDGPFRRNLEMNGHQYAVQSIWINRDGGYCGMEIESIALEAAGPSDGLVLNEVGHFTIRVTNTGTNRLDANTLHVQGGALAGEIRSTPLPVPIPVPIDPQATIEIDVPVAAPVDITGDVALVPFRFGVAEAGNNLHVFAARADAQVLVRRAPVKLDIAECAELVLPASVAVGTPFPVTARFRNRGATVWQPGAYKLVAAPLGAVLPFDGLPAALARPIGFDEEATFTFYAKAPPDTRGGTLDVVLSMANTAEAFPAECRGSTNVPCDPRRDMACNGGCGVYLCDGSCSKSEPANHSESCGHCGGKVQCDGTCSQSDGPDFGEPCGSCGGSVTCDGSCSITRPAIGASCGAKLGFLEFTVTPPDGVAGTHCHPGFVRDTFSVDGIACTGAWATSNPSDCTVKVTSRLSSGDRCTISIYELPLPLTPLPDPGLLPGRF